MRRSTLGTHGRRQWSAVIFFACLAQMVASGLAAAEPNADRAASARGSRPPAPRKVDHAVKPAGGMHAPCAHCRKSACPQCRLAQERHSGHAPCQHGLCPAHCPVRPDVFGFYGTQWRRWPGSGVVQASNLEAATPARPPRSAVPGPAEESLEPAPAPGADAAGSPPAAPLTPPDELPIPSESSRQPARNPRETETPSRPGQDAALEESREEAEPMRDDETRIQPDSEPQPADAPPDADEPRRSSTPRAPSDKRPGDTPKPPGDEDLFNLDDGPRSTPWRSFTAAARRAASAER